MSKFVFRALALTLVVLAVLGMALVTAGAADLPEINLTGEAEVPGPGDPDGSGKADLNVSAPDSRVCYTVSWLNLDPVTASHIHSGAADEAGPVVVTLFTAGSEGLVTESSRRTQLQACTTNVTPTEGMTVQEQLRDIIVNPENYYVNVHTTVFPAGAIRGQLR